VTDLEKLRREYANAEAMCRKYSEADPEWWEWGDLWESLGEQLKAAERAAFEALDSAKGGAA
jgi:hypothetical protein